MASLKIIYVREMRNEISLTLGCNIGHGNVFNLTAYGYNMSNIVIEFHLCEQVQLTEMKRKPITNSLLQSYRISSHQTILCIGFLNFISLQIPFSHYKIVILFFILYDDPYKHNPAYMTVG